MSAIYEIFRRDSCPVDAVALAVAGAPLAAWGRDGAGRHIDGAIGLGFFAQNVTPEAANEVLPLRRGERVIVADVWLDNRGELFDALDVPVAERSAIGDGELILRAYERWGEACAPRLLGDFAFAIWDGAAQTLFCARDYIGARPLVYCTDGVRFVFGSDVRAVLAGLPSEPPLSEPMIAAWLQWDTTWAEKSRTFFEGVLKVPPAHTLTVTAGGLRLHEYWKPEDVPALSQAGADEYLAQLRALLVRCVEDGMRTNLPIGAHLSGGLDSSGVAVIATRAARRSGGDVVRYAWAPPPADESVDIDHRRLAAVCAAENMDCRYVVVDPAEWQAVQQRDFTRMPTHMIPIEQPVQRMAVRDGVRVMLSGWGGDELISFNGRGILTSMVTRGQWRALHGTLVQCARTLGRGGGVWKQFKIYGGTLLQRALGSYWESAWRPKFTTTRWTDYGTTAIRPEFARAQAQAARDLRAPPYVDHLGCRAVQAQLVRNGHLTMRLEHWAREGAPLGLTYRYPLLDRRIAEFALGLPDEMYLLGGRFRGFFRIAAVAFLPVDIVHGQVKTEPALIRRNRETIAELRPVRSEQEWANIAAHPAAKYVDLAVLRRDAEQPSPAPDAKPDRRRRGTAKGFGLFKVRFPERR